MTYSLCWLAPFDPGHDCTGRRYDRVHLIPAQRLRRVGLDTADKRTWVWGCRGHHHKFDMKFIRLSRLDIPPETEEYARENGVEWSLDRDYGERENKTGEPLPW